MFKLQNFKEPSPYYIECEKVDPVELYGFMINLNDEEIKEIDCEEWEGMVC
jgi:hypothetical protein